MKKITLIIIFSFLFAIIYTGCPYWCEPGVGSHSLVGTSEISLTPQQEKYSLSDEITLAIKYSSEQNTYERILLKTSAEIYSPIKEKYVSTDNIILHNKNSEENFINENYVLSDNYNSQNQSIEENLSIQAKSSGVYRISLFLLGCKTDSSSSDFNSEYFYIKFQ